MEYREHYKSKKERDALCDKANSNGFRMLHDNFKEGWQRGDKPQGTLIFTDEPARVAPVEPTRDLAHEIDVLKGRVTLIEEGKI